MPSIDLGSTYAYGADALEPSANHKRGLFLFDAAVNARIDIIENIFLGAGRYKAMIINNTGQDFGATGNTLGYSLRTPELQ